MSLFRTIVLLPFLVLVACDEPRISDAAEAQEVEITVTPKTMLEYLEANAPDEHQLKEILEGLQAEPRVGEVFPEEDTTEDLTDVPKEGLRACSGTSSWWYKGNGLWEKWEEVCCSNPALEYHSCTWNKIKTLCLSDLCEDD